MVPPPEQSPLILGSQLQKARESAGLSLEEAASRLGVPAAELDAWESGRGEPDLSIIEHLGSIYGRDLDYFLHSTPDVAVTYKFRIPSKHSISELTQEGRLVISRFEELCRKSDLLDRLLERRRSVNLPEVGHSESVAGLAEQIRKDIGIDGKPVRKLRETLTGRGIRVFELPVPSGEFSGLSSHNGAYGPRILINARDLFGRRHFTLAHELAHLLYNHEPSVCEVQEDWRRERSRPERAADRFAVEFLLPPAHVKADASLRLSGSTPTVKELAKFATRWRVSIEAMGYRLEELQLLKQGWTLKLIERYQPPPIRRRGPRKASWERQLGDAYVSDALRAYRQGLISIGKLGDLLGIPIRRAFEIAERKSTA